MLYIFQLFIIICYLANKVLLQYYYVLRADVICVLGPGAHRYVGTVSRTKNNYTCQEWSFQSPHPHRYTADRLYADGSKAAAKNYCRNPDFQFPSLWCYTTSAQLYDLCDVPICCELICCFHQLQYSMYF